MAASLPLDLDNGHLTLEDMRQRVDAMLTVLLESASEMTEEAWKWVDENLVGTR